MSLKKFFFDNFDHNIRPNYSGRESRNRFLGDFINTKLNRGNILNIGGGGARYLERHLGRHIQVTEVDIQGDCDFKVDLEKVEDFSFVDNKTFDLVCATDVLEHLENFHLVLSEMIRVSNKYILISLPNGVLDAINAVVLGDGVTNNHDQGASSKFYGLPLSPPVDRHKWWFSWADVVRLTQALCDRENLRPIFFVRSQSLKARLLRYIMPMRYYILFCPTYWILLEKRETHDQADTVCCEGPQ